MTQQLYRLYNADDELLYVGISVSALHRITQHKKDKPWWPKVAKITIETHDVDRASIRKLERQAIQDERPKYNIHWSRTRGLVRAATAPIPVSQFSFNGLGIQRPYVVVGEVVGLAMRGNPRCWVGRIADASDSTVMLDLYQWSTRTFGFDRCELAVTDIHEAFVAGPLSKKQKARLGIESKTKVWDMDSVAEYQRFWKDYYA